MTIGYAFVVFSLLPLIKSDKWFIRVFDYPRSQKFLISLAVLVAFVFIADYDSTAHLVFIFLISANVIYLLTQIWSYTPLARIQMQRNSKGTETSVKILIANVFQDNDQFERCVQAIKANDPDVVLLVEVDKKWCSYVSKALVDYEFRVEHPMDNTYGMALYSRLEIERHSLRFLVDDEIPSITADIRASDGRMFRMYCIHPTPPVPNEASDSTDRDAEILIVGKEAKKCNMPVVVAGDLNDVAWSYTTNLFLKASGLLDPRIGRGFFSTFHARYRIFRWPLDHVFCSTHFCLNSLKRLDDIGSDHFPIFIDVAMQHEKTRENVEQQKDLHSEDRELVEEKIEKAKAG